MKKLNHLICYGIVLLQVASFAYADMEEGAPQNELFIYWDTAYLTDLQAYWNLASISYLRNFGNGKIGPFINRGNKFGDTANQYGIEIDPEICDWLHLNTIFSTAANSQIVFPSNNYYVEAYFNLSNYELSLGNGGMFYAMYGNQNIITYTASAGMYYGNYFPWVRASTYSLNGTYFVLAGLRRYFADSHSYVSLSINTGKLPDIGSLPPLADMIVMHQKAINVDGQFPVHKNWYVHWHLGYAYQMYPNNHLRLYEDISLALLWRF